MKNYLDRVRDIPGVTVGPSLRFPGDTWRDYPVTVSRGEQEYRVATVTVYDDDVTAPLTLPSNGAHSHLATVRRALSRMQDAAGIPLNREERDRTSRGYFVDLRGWED